MDRREFVIGSAAAGTGLALGFNIPSGAKEAIAQAAAPELNAWVVVKPDDTVVIRIARAEMGQGTHTGLAQLVAEELECDWSRVRHEFPSTAEHLRRDRVFVTMATGGSRAIRDSNVYLRKAGATAREMLIGAAAERWGVPASECRAKKSVVTHRPIDRAPRAASRERWRNQLIATRQASSIIRSTPTFSSSSLMRTASWPLSRSDTVSTVSASIERSAAIV